MRLLRHNSASTAPRALILSALVALCGTLAGCESRDLCIDARRELVASPSGARHLEIIHGPCEGAVPDVRIAFGTGAARVFASADSDARVDARWIAEDTAEITYAQGERATLRDTIARVANEQVVVHYLIAPRSTIGR